MKLRFLLNKLISKLPSLWQQEIRRHYYGVQILFGRFTAQEPEYRLLEGIINAGDWVIDIGANVGHYTKRISDLVGPSGRVFAFEPVPNTFAALTANVGRFRHHNVTLINAAASDSTAVVGMHVPTYASGLENYYEAHLTAEAASIQVATLAIDALALPRRVSLVKMDVEGHERAALQGMLHLLRRDHPALIVETSDKEVIASLEELGYSYKRVAGSANVVVQVPLISRHA